MEESAKRKDIAMAEYSENIQKRGCKRRETPKPKMCIISNWEYFKSIGFMEGTWHVDDSFIQDSGPSQLATI